jgi:hypothetical protein
VCTSLKNIEPIKNFKKIKYLDLVIYDSLEDLNGLQHLATLEELSLSGWRDSNLELIDNLTSLKRLALDFVVTDIDFFALTKLEKLKSLRLVLVGTKINLPIEVIELPELEYLNLWANNQPSIYVNGFRVKSARRHNCLPQLREHFCSTS